MRVLSKCLVRGVNDVIHLQLLRYSPFVRQTESTSCSCLEQDLCFYRMMYSMKVKNVGPLFDLGSIACSNVNGVQTS